MLVGRINKNLSILWSDHGLQVRYCGLTMSDCRYGTWTTALV